jgi:sulfur-oxidizing protein SoxZ
MKVKAKFKDGITHVRLLARHPMENGRRLDPRTNQPIPARFIQELSCEYHGHRVFFAQMGPGISKDPYLAFAFIGGAKDDTIKLRGNDNAGDVEITEAVIR